MINPWTSNYKSHQGNVGLGMAIAYYSSKCFPVMIPLNDTQKYDLVVEKEGTLNRIQVKTTMGKSKKSQYFIVQLKHSGGSDNKQTITKFNNTFSDFLFVYTMEGTMYEIPTGVIKNTSALTLNNKFEKYKVSFD